jgi:hypothetical protein
MGSGTIFGWLPSKSKQGHTTTMSQRLTDLGALLYAYVVVNQSSLITHRANELDGSIHSWSKGRGYSWKKKTALVSSKQLVKAVRLRARR